MTRDQKIQAAIAMTEANLEHHRIHLEEGYVEASIYLVSMQIMGKVAEPNRLHDVEIWGINKYGKLQMI